MLGGVVHHFPEDLGGLARELLQAGRGAGGPDRHPLQPRGRAVREAEERLLLEERENPAGGHEVTVPDPEGNPTTLRVSAHGERIELLERELARVRRELASPTVTDTVMAEVVG